jgi:hypothetical protein
MNDKNIENLLFQAPKPAAPNGLLKQLEAEIALPSAKLESKPREWRHPLRRWFPALAFGMLMLSCALMIAVQASWSTNLKRENEALRTTTAELPQLREQHAALEQAQAKHDELAQLRRDNDELHQLQAEVGKLRGIPAQIQQLQNENKRLAAEARLSGTNASDVLKALEDAQARAARIQCVNNLKQVGLAFRIWGGDNGDKYPTSFIVMSNELSTTKILVCPSDQERQPFASLGFGEFQDNMSSYQLTGQPDDGKLSFPQCIIAKCPIHLNYLLADGSVQQINPAKPQYHEVQKDGRWYLQELQPGETFQDRIIQTIK